MQKQGLRKWGTIDSSWSWTHVFDPAYASGK
jgi:hypothetical protein